MAPVAEIRPQPLTDVALARGRLLQYGENFREKSRGNTLIHMCDTPAMVYVCANSHVPINAQNFVSTSLPVPLDTSVMLELELLEYSVE